MLSLSLLFPPCIHFHSFIFFLPSVSLLNNIITPDFFNLYAYSNFYIPLIGISSFFFLPRFPLCLSVSLCLLSLFSNFFIDALFFFALPQFDVADFDDVADLIVVVVSIYRVFV